MTENTHQALQMATNIAQLAILPTFSMTQKKIKVLQTNVQKVIKKPRSWMDSDPLQKYIKVVQYFYTYGR
jgi:hypothetical protein